MDQILFYFSGYEYWREKTGKPGVGPGSQEVGPGKAYIKATDLGSNQLFKIHCMKYMPPKSSRKATTVYKMPVKKFTLAAPAKEAKEVDKQATEAALMQDLFELDKEQEPSATSTPVAGQSKGKGPGVPKSTKKPVESQAKPVTTLQAKGDKRDTSAVTLQSLEEVDRKEGAQQDNKKRRIVVNDEEAFGAWLERQRADAVRLDRQQQQQARESAMRAKREKEAAAEAALQQAELKRRRAEELDHQIAKAMQEREELSHQAVVGGVVLDEEIPIAGGSNSRQEEAAVSNKEDIKDFKIRSLEAQLLRERSRQASQASMNELEEEPVLTIDEDELEEGEVGDPTAFNFSKSSVNVDLSKRCWTTWKPREIQEDRKRLLAQLHCVLQQGKGHQRVMAEIASLAQETMHDIVRSMSALNQEMAGGTRSNVEAFREAMNETDQIVGSK